MSSEQFSLRIPQDTKKRLDELAKATGRSKAYLAIDAIERYLDLESWQIRAIQTGLKEVENENTFSLDEIKKSNNSQGIIQVQIDENLEKEAEELFSSLGLDISTAIRIFLTMSIETGGIPFAIKRNEQSLIYNPLINSTTSSRE